MQQQTETWTIEDSAELYDLPRWGLGYFTIGSNGNLRVHPERDVQRFIDLKELVSRLELRGLDLPILIRFNGILKDRLQELHRAFSATIKEHDYRGNYSCVFPIKVNQQRQVVEEIVKHGAPLGFGLEAGSKPELLAVVAMTEPQMPVVCNGFKDAEFIEMAMYAQKIGRRVIPVVEKLTECDLILEIAHRIGVRPQIGVRVKLAARGSGRWEASGGFRSKFGLTVSEVMQVMERLRECQMLDCFKLLHFHLGSQITDIRFIKTAINEIARIYTDLSRQGAGLEYLDVGGGLGVDYDGSQTNFESSMNYTLEEYASDVVYHVGTVCDEMDVPHPHLISESGRAVAAYHCVLAFNVLGVSGKGNGVQLPDSFPEAYEPPLHDLLLTYHSLSVKNMLESFHDARHALDQAITLFMTGHLPLVQRSLAEELYFAICHRIHFMLEDVEFVPEELERLDAMLADTYFCNFSLFQSLPDSWAIKQLFPIVPIHRLHERPTGRAVLGDITCDSDGKIDRFIDRRDVRRTLPLHRYDGAPYVLGAFLLGAYQEILGDLHNLFGDTHAVHVNINDNNEPVLETIVKGETVAEVLDYVQFRDSDLIHRLQVAVEEAVQAERIDHHQAGKIVRFYEDALRGYTYLE